MPNRPTRPGKHAARHKAPTAFSRATARLASTGGRRTSGTVIALGAVVLAGAAGNGATTAYVSAGSSARQTKVDASPPRPSASLARERAAEVGDVSRSSATREPLAQAVPVRRDHTAEDETGSTSGTASHTARAASIVPDDPREIAESMLDDYGWDSSEMSCLDDLWVSESNWEVDATNPTSGAYGIPQALPAGKMATAGSDWRTNPATQIEWGLDYIESSYGSPCSAWEFKQSNDWY